MPRSHLAHPERPVPRTLLGVWAHPDDEAFLSAGLMALTADAGARVVVATATLGERGTSDPGTWPPERLAPVRRAELRRSLDVVGVKEHRMLGHRDGELANVAWDVAVAQVAELLDEIAPDTIVTFGPEGMTGHDDHQAVSRWVTAAWRLTGGAARLWYATATPSFHARWGRLNREVGVYLPGSRPPSTPPEELAFDLDFDEQLTRRKHAAIRAHASQTDALAAHVGEETFRRWWAAEWFVAADRVNGRQGRVRAGHTARAEDGDGHAGR